jgi:hypothetical protein
VAQLPPLTQAKLDQSAALTLTQPVKEQSVDAARTAHQTATQTAHDVLAAVAAGGSPFR